MPLAPELIKELQEFLSKVTISQILKNHWKQHAPREVIRISSTLSVEEAFDVLVKYNISAAPVYNESSSSYLGMVSMHDVAEYVVTLVKANKQVLKDLEPGNNETHGIAISEIVNRLRELKPVPVQNISDLSMRDPFVSLPTSSTLDEAISLFAQGIHRIMVHKEGSPNQLVSILTQSDMIRYMSDQIKLSPFNRILAYKLSDLQLSLPKNLVLVKCSQSLLDALQAMHMNRVSSVAVVDNSGKLLGNISAADVKYIMRNLRYGILFDTCAHFINKVKTTKMLENAGKDSVPVIQCSPHIVLVQLIKVLLVMQVHRIWITEQSPDLPTFQEPISVISLTDIFRALVPSTNRD